MSETQNTPSPEQKTAQAVEEASKSVLGALLDLGSTWAAHGLNAGKFSLENSARALEKTAKVLESMARDIEKRNTKV